MNEPFELGKIFAFSSTPIKYERRSGSLERVSNVVLEVGRRWWWWWGGKLSMHDTLWLAPIKRMQSKVTLRNTVHKTKMAEERKKERKKEYKRKETERKNGSLIEDSLLLTLLSQSVGYRAKKSFGKRMDRWMDGTLYCPREKNNEGLFTENKEAASIRKFHLL